MDYNEGFNRDNLRKRKYPFYFASSSSEQFSDGFDNESSTIFQVYEKTQGAGHLLGSEYQYLMCALYALKLCRDDRVNDFNLTTNNFKYKVFDDIIINVEFKDQSKATFVFQLKHGEPKRNLTVGDFARQNLKNKNFLKNPYCLVKHIEFIKNVKEENVVCILFTNNSTSLTDGLEIDFEKDKVVVEKCDSFAFADLLANTATAGDDIFHLKIRSGDENFPSEFYLFVNQDNVFSLRHLIEEALQRLLICDIYGSFVHFMENWWVGNFVLTKSDVISKLAELSLSPYVKTISGEYHNLKTKNLAKCIMDFDITIVESSEDNIVTKIWNVAEMLKKVGLASSSISSAVSKYGISTNPDVFSLSNLQISKALWYLNTVPLTIKVNDENRDQVKSVLNLLKSHFKKKKLVLIENRLEAEQINGNVFRTLTDLMELQDKETYMYIINNFYVSIQEKQVIPLVDLLWLSTTIFDLFGVRELLEMTQRTFFIGKKEELPDLYISRSISTVAVDTQKLLDNVSNSNSLIIINCEKRFPFNFNIMSVIELSQYLINEDCRKIPNLILISSRKCNIDDFNAVCQISGKSVYLFQYYNEKSFLLLKKGDALDLEEICEVQNIEDLAVLKYFNNPLNFVCAPVGAGKSTLFSFLSRNCPPNVWAIHVDLKEHADFLKNNPDDAEILTRLLQIHEEESFSNKFKILMMKAKKIYLFLDELDQIGCSQIDLILKFVKRISSAGGYVWIASRDHLKDRIVETFNIVPLEIVELNENQQKDFFNMSLQSCYSSVEIDKIVNLIFESVSVTNSYDLLGLPLDLVVLTEVLMKDRTILEKTILEVTTIYTWLFDGIVRFLCKKMRLEESGVQLEWMSYRLEQYQFFSLKHLLGEEDFRKIRLNSRKLEKFLNEINTSGDSLGIIRKIKPAPIFIHQQFAEYFAALWLSENLDCLDILERAYFSEECQHLRFFFDIILSEENDLLLSIIYGNIQEIPENSDRRKDKGGRNVLHIACSYGLRYPPNPTYDKRVNRESKIYMELIEKFLSTQNVSEHDNLFKLAPFSYAVRSRCLYAVEKFLESDKHRNFDLSRICSTRTLAYYASQLGYSNLLSLVLEEDPGVLNEDFGERSLLELSVLGCENENYSSPREGNIAALRILLERINNNEVKEALLTLACEYKCYDMIKPLLHLGTEISNENTILHLAAHFGTLDADMLRMAKDLEVDVNAKNADGKTVFDIGYEKRDLNLLKLLLDEDVTCSRGSYLHYAVVPNSDVEMIDLVIKRAGDINAEGLTAFELAQKIAPKEYLDPLRERGSLKNLKTLDSKFEENQLSSRFQNNLTLDKLSSEKMEISQQSQMPSHSGISEIFQKRAGSTDKGREYEFLVMTYITLRLLLQDDVKDFTLSANDSDFDYFDDLVVNIECDKHEITYALQLKHTGNSRTAKPITKEHLISPRGNFSLIKYFRSYQNIKRDDKYTKLILYTNQLFGLREGQEILFDKDEFSAKVIKSRPEPFLNSSKFEDTCYSFAINNERYHTNAKLLKEWQEFFDHLCIYASQSDVSGINNKAAVLFQTTFDCNESVYDQYVKFLTEWNHREGRKEKLNKEWIQNKITLLLLTPFIRPFSSGSVNRRMELLREAISEFPVTVFSQEMYEAIRYLWGNVSYESNQEEIYLKRKYHLDDRLDTSNQKEVMMWLMGKAPLMVSENPFVYKAAEMCQNKKFIFLGKCPPIWPFQSSVFKKLSDLNSGSDLYKEILKEFEFSVHGRIVNLEYLIGQDREFSNFLTTDHLAEMLRDYKIEDKKESFPEGYIVRSLSKLMVSSTYLRNVDDNIFIVISCCDPEKVDQTAGPNISNFIENISFEEFEKITTTLRRAPTYHHFKYVDDENLEWVQTKGDISDLQPYRVNSHFVEETMFFKEIRNKINLISGPPGCGKTQLLRHLKNMSNVPTIILQPEEIFSLGENVWKNIEMKELLLRTNFKDCKDLDKKVLEILIERNQIMYFWDAFDEVPSEGKESVINTVLQMSQKGVTQLIACRGNTEKELEKRLGVLARYIRPLSNEEQETYIRGRFQESTEIDRIVENIKSGFRLPRHDDILNTPLQLFMVTELFRHDSGNLPETDHIFTLTDLYNKFIESKYEMYVREKLKINLNDKFLKQVFENHKKSMMENYEKTALKILFSDESLQGLNVEKDNNHDEDYLGFVVPAKEGSVNFIHSSFAEYFAAGYLCKNYETLPDLKIIFEEKFTNVRFFFDLLLAKNSSAHTAVLYNNVNLLRGCVEDLRSCKDMGGRNLLHLASSWGKRYAFSNVCPINDETGDLAAKEEPGYVDILLFLLEKCDALELDSLFRMTPLSYADAAGCLFAKRKLSGLK